tara:strand:- start:33730 stop:35121 length:1392 start_codon:yes stop_codon:yes gene_type:complete
MSENLPSEFLTQLKKSFLDKQVYTEPSDCWAYGYDNSRKHALPDAVIFAESHEDVVNAIRMCYQHNIPITARGRGTNTTGATVPVSGGVILSIERMQKILSIEPQNRIMIVEPGVLNQAAQIQAKEYNLFWPPDPTSSPYSCIGGNIGAGAGGPRAVKYGTVRENILGLTAVTGDGTTIHTGVHTTKGSVGYDLTRLIIGSEGTLAVVTQAILKLLPIPESKRTIRAFYNKMEGALEAVIKIMQQPIVPCGVEFMDGNAVSMIRNFSHPELPEQAQSMLIIEVDGAERNIESDVNEILNALKNQNLIDTKVAATQEETNALWKIRKSLSASLRSLSPHKINEDVIVPVGYLNELLVYTNQLAKDFDIQIVNFGHAGNGNIHVNLLVDPFDPIKGPAAQKCLKLLFEKVLSLKGSLSGEHGVGMEKSPYISMEVDKSTLQLMKNIKAQFDPKGILNPKKLFPLE